MKNTITRVDALNFAIDCILSAPAYSESRGDGEIVAVLEKMRDQIAKPRKTSDEAKAKAKAKRADARATLMAQVVPILREVITTDMTANLTADDLHALHEATPLGRSGTPEDVAKAMVYLADADFVTGQVLAVNGGFVIT